MSTEYKGHQANLGRYKPVSDSEKELEKLVKKFNDHYCDFAPKAMLSAIREIVNFLNTVEVSEELKFELEVFGILEFHYGGRYEIMFNPASQKWEVESEC
jgi:hypothetical protein